LQYCRNINNLATQKNLKFLYSLLSGKQKSSVQKQQPEKLKNVYNNIQIKITIKPKRLTLKCLKKWAIQIIN